MKTFLKNYKQTLILLAAIIIGAIAGLILGEKATVLSPLGDLFINLMFIIIVPLVFLTISTSISKITQPKRVGKILGTIVLVFVITSLVSVLIGLAFAYPIRLVEVEDGQAILAGLEETDAEAEKLSILDRTVSVLTVSDFSGLFSKNNIVAIIVFALLFGCAIRMSGEKGKRTQELLESLTEVIMSVLKLVMYYAPIGLGCYFAALIGTFGASIAVGYLKTFVIYTIACVICYFGVYTLYAFIAAGKTGVKRYWSSIIPATVTALATCSSAASIPVNLQAAKKIGVSDDIAETLIPLGTSFHKDGSIIGSVFKAMFLVYLFGLDLMNPAGFVKILLISVFATLLVTAVPIGGGTISETLIITMLGCPLSALPILTIIATIIDAPATVLNVVGDSASSMLAARIIDGKDWIKE
ncbi:MAG: dicarboxylate/amino acid:cation symporter [Clostridia bacterium]|nr:dicarboxylate/amino acid:cation symporter [Clostridia bacterium]